MLRNIEPDVLEELFKAHFAALAHEDQKQLIKELMEIHWKDMDVIIHVSIIEGKNEPPKQNL